MSLGNVRRVDPLFVAFVQVYREFNPFCAILTMCGQVPMDLLLDGLLVRLPLGVSPKLHAGKSLRFTGLPMLYSSAHYRVKIPCGLFSFCVSDSACRQHRNLRAHPLRTSQDLPHLRLV